MRTIKQIEASRRNGAKSRGQNAWKNPRPVVTLPVENDQCHQHLAATVVHSGESNELFLEMVNKLTLELQPTNEAEVKMIEDLARCRWDHMRTVTLLHETIETEMARHPGPAPNRALAAARNRTPDILKLREDEKYYRHEFESTLRTFILVKRAHLQCNPDTVIDRSPTNSFFEPEEESPSAEPDDSIHG